MANWQCAIQWMYWASRNITIFSIFFNYRQQKQ